MVECLMNCHHAVAVCDVLQIQYLQQENSSQLMYTKGKILL